MKTNDVLKNKMIKLPDPIIEGLKVSLNTFKNSDDKAGIKRAQDLISNKRISFKEMERLKNYFETEANLNEDGENEQEYRLSGGDLMKEFVINGVKTLRGAEDRVKRAKMKAGGENEYIKKHTKDVDNANPTKVNKANIQTTSDEIMDNRTTYSESYKKEIEGMRYLIEYMNDNNNKLIK